MAYRLPTDCPRVTRRLPSAEYRLPTKRSPFNDLYRLSGDDYQLSDDDPHYSTTQACPRLPSLQVADPDGDSRARLVSPFPSLSGQRPTETTRPSNRPARPRQTKPHALTRSGDTEIHSSVEPRHRLRLKVTVLYLFKSTSAENNASCMW